MSPKERIRQHGNIRFRALKLCRRMDPCIRTIARPNKADASSMLIQSVANS